MEQKLRCQSCGMLLGKEYFGSNEDGSACLEFCKFCFQEGCFTEPDLTVDQMIDRSVKLMVEQKQFSQEKAKELAETSIPYLVRWQCP